MSASIAVQMVKIPVSDINKVLPFYRDVLGLAEDFVMAEYGWAQLSADNLPIALYVPGMGGGTAKAGEADSLHLSVTDDVAFRAQLVGADIDVEDISHQGDDGSLFYELQDPDGNIIKVMVIQPQSA